MNVWRLALTWVLAGFSPCVFAAGSAGAPDPDAFRNWRLTLHSHPVISGLTYAQGKWVGVGDGIYYSTDGLHWTPTAVLGDHFWRVVEGDGVFVAVGHDTQSAIQISTNGIEWTGTLPGSGSDFWDVAYGDGTFVAGGSQGRTFWVSTNRGASWAYFPQPFQCYGICFGDGKFVATGYTRDPWQAAATGVSTDGIEWTFKLQGDITNRFSSPYLMRGTYADGRFIVVGTDGGILVSEDAVNWTKARTPITDVLWGVAGYNQRYVAVGYRTILISTNALDWDGIPSLDPDSLFTDITVGNNSFAAIYYHSTFSSGINSAVQRSDPLDYIKPLFVKHPVGTEQRLGSPTNLVAVIEGTSPMTFQWQRNGFDIPGATGSQLSFASLERSDDASYRLVARNGVGETASAEAQVRVGLPPTVLAHPTSQLVPAGGAVTLSAMVDATLPITNRWRKPGSIFVTQVLHEVTSFLRLENVQPSHAGIYGVSVENRYGRTASLPATLTVVSDADADGLPDNWEQQNGVSEPGEDVDGDGLTNLQEFQAGTDPKNAQSYLKVERIESASGGAAVILSFLARSNQTYSVQSREQLASGSWQRLLDVVASSADRVVTVTNAVAANQSYFRLVTPRTE